MTSYTSSTCGGIRYRRVLTGSIDTVKVMGDGASICDGYLGVIRVVNSHAISLSHAFTATQKDTSRDFVNTKYTVPRYQGSVKIGKNTKRNTFSVKQET
jgi:hypothetical protein